MCTITARASGDRFVPYRYLSHIDDARHKLSTSPKLTSPFQHDTDGDVYGRLLASVFESSAQKQRLFVFSSENVVHTCCMFNRRISTYSQGDEPPLPTAPTTDLIESCHVDKLIRRRREVDTRPESVRDLPGFTDDFYSHLMDWSSNDRIVVAIGNEVYMWNYSEKSPIERGVIHTHGRHADGRISALSWKPSAEKIVIASNHSNVMLWDVCQAKILNAYSGWKKSHIGSLAWLDGDTFVSGSRRGQLIAIDTRISCFALVPGSGAWVCGMQTSPDGRYLLVGRDDGIVQVWNTRMTSVYVSFEAHTAGVRALAWCPWQKSVITTGGGSSDRHIRQFNIHTKKLLFEIDCQSQVCEIVWSDKTREMVSSHGVAGEEGNNIELWLLLAHPHAHLVHIATFAGHRARPLHLSLGVDRVTLASASGDESLRLWKPFKKNTYQKIRCSSQLDLFTSIR